MDIEAYLERINYRGSRAPSAQTLRDLQLAHLWAVPFENLSIHAGEPIVLEDAALFEKVVVRRRGGFCYELNGLFAALLRALDFNVSMHSAGVADDKGGFSPDFDHMTLVVRFDEPWLVDVGFGDSFREPINIDDTNVQEHAGRAYRIVTDENYLILMERKNNDEWKPQYRFNLQTYHYTDYAGRCHYHQTSSESHFTQRRVCSRATPEGRVTLSGMRFITTTLSGERQERALTNEEEYAILLHEHFGVIM